MLRMANSADAVTAALQRELLFFFYGLVYCQVGFFELK